MKAKLIATVIVLLHSLVLLGHGKAHLQLHIEASPWQRAFIAVVIFIAPVVATALLWTPLQKTGFALLSLSMAGSLVFGVAYHFLIRGPDNALALPDGQLESLFKTTATWLTVVEAGAVTCCIWAMKSTVRLNRA